MLQKDEALLLDAGILAGKILMENGAEMHRVEDTVNRLLDINHGANEATSFVMPTGIFVTSRFGNNTSMKRITKRTQNMEKIAAVNKLSRDFAQGDMAVETLFQQMQDIDKNTDDFPKWLKIISAGFISGAMTLIFGGPLQDLVLTILIGSLGYALYCWVAKTMKVRFVQEFVASLVMASLVYYAQRLGLVLNIDTAILGCIIVLVPGIQIMNSIRDFFVGNTVSGTVFMIEAIFIAGMIGAGVMAAVRF